MLLSELTQDEQSILKFIFALLDRQQVGPFEAAEIHAGLPEMTPEQVNNALGILESRGMFQHPEDQVFYSPRRHPVTLLPGIREQYSS